MEEIWKFIEGYDEAYRVSNLGRVQSCKKRGRVGKNNVWRELRLKKDKGYLRCALFKNSLPKKIQVHILVLNAFSVNINNHPQVNHIDGNRSNNKLENLEWVSRRENQTHRHLLHNLTKIVGVTFNKRDKMFYSKITISGKAKYLGCFKTSDEAHAAYIKALQDYGITNKYATCNTSQKMSEEQPVISKESK